jgi:hypothetical protein
MKASDYLKQYDDAGRTPEALARVWIGLVNEIKPMSLQRGIKTAAGAVAIFDEIDGKWRAFARLAGDQINPDGFMNVFKKRMPELYVMVKAEKDLQVLEKNMRQNYGH